MEFLVFLGIVAGLVVDYLIANEFRKIAVDKGYSHMKYFWIAFLLGVAGYILIAAMPDRNAQRLNNSANITNPANSSDELPDL